jgi:hypothetical protein
MTRRDIVQALHFGPRQVNWYNLASSMVDEAPESTLKKSMLVAGCPPSVQPLHTSARPCSNGQPQSYRGGITCVNEVQLIAQQKGLNHPVIDAIVALIDRRLEANRQKAA